MNRRYNSASNMDRKNRFLQLANDIHGNKYDYSKIKYINNYIEVEIICPIHKLFLQQPNRHLFSEGCPQCGRINQSKMKAINCGKKFKGRAILIHNGKYTYDKVQYVNAVSNVIITCPIHGDFTQIPNSHIKKNKPSGCPTCAHNGVSRKAMDWLKQIEKQYNMEIIGMHRNLQEYKIPGTSYKVDGYHPPSNTIYEYYGDVWHGNLQLYNPETKCHPFNNLTAQELYDNTMNREKHLGLLGYNVISVWENQQFDNIDGKMYILRS